MPTYVLSKIKRTISGQKTVDSADIDGKIVLEAAEASDVVTLKGKDADGNDVTITLGTAAKKTAGNASGQLPSLRTGGRFHVDRVAWSGTQSDYDALTPDDNTLYMIMG